MSKRDEELSEWRGVCEKLKEKPPIHPGRGKILICREPAEGETEGGIIVPDQAQVPPRKGVVIATGELARNMAGGQIQFWVKPGDLVYFSAYVGSEINLGKKFPFKLLIINEDDLTGRVN